MAADVLGDGALEVPAVEHENVVEALASPGAATWRAAYGSDTIDDMRRGGWLAVVLMVGAGCSASDSAGPDAQPDAAAGVPTLDATTGTDADGAYSTVARDAPSEAPELEASTADGPDAGPSAVDASMLDALANDASFVGDEGTLDAAPRPDGAPDAAGPPDAAGCDWTGYWSWTGSAWAWVWACSDGGAAAP
jgi:hypothetical protein